MKRNLFIGLEVTDDGMLKFHFANWLWGSVESYLTEHTNVIPVAVYRYDHVNDYDFPSYVVAIKRAIMDITGGHAWTSHDDMFIDHRFADSDLLMRELVSELDDFIQRYTEFWNGWF